MVVVVMESDAGNGSDNEEADSFTEELKVTSTAVPHVHT